MATASDLAHEANKQIAKLQSEFDFREKEIGKLHLQDLREHVAVLADRVDKLKKRIEESDKRRWQFVYIIAGALAMLLVSVLVQLVLLPLVKK